MHSIDSYFSLCRPLTFNVMKIDVSGHVVPAKQESTFSRHITKQEQTNKAKIGIFKSLTNQRILQENYLINDAHFLINYPNEQKAKSDNFLTFEEVDDSCSNEMVLKMFDSFSTFLKRFNNNQLDRIKHELREGHFFMILCIPKMAFFHRF